MPRAFIPLVSAGRMPACAEIAETPFNQIASWHKMINK